MRKWYPVLLIVIVAVASVIYSYVAWRQETSK
jgi:hypothetical protein